MSQLISIVDDNIDIVELVAEILRDEGYAPHAVLPCPNTVLALHIAAPAAIILDLHLMGFEAGHGSGWQVLEGIRRDTMMVDTPVIVCSSDTWALASMRAELRRYGCHALAKPFMVHDLVVMLQSALANPLSLLKG